METDTQTQTRGAEHAREPGTPGITGGAGPGVLDPRSGGLARRAGTRLAGHPVVAFLVVAIAGFAILAGLAVAGGWVLQTRSARSRHRPRRRACERMVVTPPHRDSQRRFVLAVRDRRRLCHPGGGRAHRPRRPRPPSLAHRRVRDRGDRDRGRHLSRGDARDPPGAAARAPPRPPAGERQLLLGSHRCVGRRLLRRRAARDVADPQRRCAYGLLAHRRGDSRPRRPVAHVPRHAPSHRRRRRRARGDRNADRGRDGGRAAGAADPTEAPSP